ncbi:glycosyltransferase family 2 protein [Spirosoma soli]|uniref:Glycosyltransferase family 2 protein n=1 Tax=Spirosoma soli TaxID=1770529 RepID=A0ABW5M9Z6_9BACT
MKPEQTPLVSVVICFLNEEVFLAESVNSVLAQAYTAWELLLVDDGSTDGSTALSKQFAEQYPAKIRYIDHDGHANRGLSASRNVGIQQATGTLLAFLDADDIWLPNKLSMQVEIMQKQPKADVLLEATEYWYSWSDPKKEDIPKLIGAEPNRLYEPPQLMYHLYPLGEGEAPSMSGMMIKTALAQQQLFEESFVNMYEDQAFLSKLYLHATVYITSSCSHRYRQRMNSIMHTVQQLGNYSQIRAYFLKWLQNYLDARQIHDSHLRRLLWKAQLPYRSPLAYKGVKLLSSYFPKYINKYLYRI